ncbi:MOT14-like protein [Mya arenaria]|uniref:MOT14-like protein n=1 Tax=Mya arenaria TaxID=6604 RepID=A0ABY7G1Y9_MYAAR|nr:MOT14-like protein [Mya arenaria]
MGDKTLKQNDNHTDIVQDSAWCWVIVIGAFLAHVITHGILYSFGILFIALEEKYGGTKAEIALIPSLMSGTLYLVGPLVSALITRYGCRTVTALGAVIGALGFITSVFANSLYLLYFTLGVLTGCGFGFVFLAAIVVVTRHFQKHRSLACGLALSGAGGGAFICSPLIEWLLATFSLSGTLLILAAIVLNCIPCGLLFRSVRGAHTNRAAETGRDLEYDSVLHETFEVCGDAEQEVQVHYDAKDEFDTFKQNQTEGSEHYTELANMPSKLFGSSEEDNGLQNSNYEAETQSVIVDDNIVIEIVNQNEFKEKEAFIQEKTANQNEKTFKPPNRRRKDLAVSDISGASRPGGDGSTSGSVRAEQCLQWSWLPPWAYVCSIRDN